MLTPKFATVTHSFHTELKKRIGNYFEEVGKSTTGNYKLFLKAVILMVSFSFVYIHLVFFTPAALWAILECVLLGGIVAAIGFNVMHDGAHGSFSKYKWVNHLPLFPEYPGGNSFMWNQKHNVIHHAFTNVDGVDDDIDIQPWMRMSATQRNIVCINTSTCISGSSTPCCTFSGSSYWITRSISKARWVRCRLRR